MRIHSTSSLPLTAICSITTYASLTHALPAYSPFRLLPEAGLAPPPSIGFDLTLDHGTAAIQWPNGTTINVVKINGDERYKSLMSRLIDEAISDPHHIGFSRIYSPGTDLPPTLDTSQPSSSDDQPAQKQILPEWEENLSDHDRQSQPSTSFFSFDSDVRTIGELVYWLRVHVETHLGRAISAAAISFSTVIRLPRKTLTRAIERAGIRDLMSDQAPLSTVSTALVALEENEDEETEEEEMVSKLGHPVTSSGGVLVIEWTEMALVTTMIGAGSAGVVTAIDREVGQARMSPEAPIETTAEGYSRSDQVRAAIARLPLHLAEQQSLDYVVLLGEHVNDEDFVEQVHRALCISLLETKSERLVSVLTASKTWNPLYAAAKGAARVAAQALARGMVEESSRAFMAEKQAQVDALIKELR